MQPEPSSPPPADWAALPADILHLVFSRLLAPPPALGATGLPLTRLVRQWFALAGTCKLWRDALSSVPLAVEVSAAPAACLAWLAARPVRRLHIARSDAASLAAAEEELVLDQGLTIEQAAAGAHDWQINVPSFGGRGDDAARQAYQRERSIARDPRAANMFPWLAAAAGQSVSLDSMMSELEGVMDDGSPTQQAAAKSWSLATWQHLESLLLEGPVNWHGDLSFFAAASLGALPRLHTLSLTGFYGYDLSGLPTSLRHLRLHFEPYMPEHQLRQEMYFSFSLLELPETARLDELVVEKSHGAVAFEWGPLSRRCRRLLLHGGLGASAALLDSPRQVLIGVPLTPEETALWEALSCGPAGEMRSERADGRQAATAAWLKDFAHGSDCLLSELCVGYRIESSRDLLQLVPLAPSGHNGDGGSSEKASSRGSHPGALAGAAAQQLHAYHMLALSNDTTYVRDYFPATDVAPALREAAASHPNSLLRLDRSWPEPLVRPGLLSLVQQLRCPPTDG
ncbi:integrase family [Chlorella sorokiniana]|uniref:Integrase family n=1 Tax=Chlorella sorokiniana TaxID=3076 RepID=A0A2P6TVG8_CHLSO|nr:integrase family [Chlorella sorokiniana]|eukprot:PRW58046.1 integrase family [Chlorella sorokiniana]